MAEEKQHTEQSNEQTVWDSVKKEFTEVRELASLRIKAASLSSKREGLYTKLGKQYYTRLHSEETSVIAKSEKEIATLDGQIHAISDELVSLRLEIKMKQMEKR